MSAIEGFCGENGGFREPYRRIHKDVFEKRKPKKPPFAGQKTIIDDTP
jgi:hypothetical protein